MTESTNIVSRARLPHHALLYRAGFKQWGLAMQDDVADARQWAIKQGYADPKRVCIAGASHGGYATLMGLIRDPELYRCGFQWVGVMDIDLMSSINWSDYPSEGHGWSLQANDIDFWTRVEKFLERNLKDGA